MTIDVKAVWHGRLETGGCDEGCNAYVFVELQDAGTGHAIAGYTRYEFDTMLDVDGTTLPLRWGKVPTDPQAKAAVAAGKAYMAGGQVRLRVFFRDATVYALNHGQEQEQEVS